MNQSATYQSVYTSDYNGWINSEHIVFNKQTNPLSSVTSVFYILWFCFVLPITLHICASSNCSTLKFSTDFATIWKLYVKKCRQKTNYRLVFQIKIESQFLVHYNSVWGGTEIKQGNPVLLQISCCRSCFAKWRYILSYEDVNTGISCFHYREWDCSDIAI